MTQTKEDLMLELIKKRIDELGVDEVVRQLHSFQGSGPTIEEFLADLRGDVITKRQQFEQRYPVPVGIYWDDHEKRYFTTWSAYCKELHELSEEWTGRFYNFEIPRRHIKTHHSQRWSEHVCSYCGESQQK